MFVLLGRIVFQNMSLKFNRPIHPLFIVFPKQSVASHNEPFQKSVAVHRELHILRRTRAIMAAWAVDGRDHLLMETDHLIGDARRNGKLWLLLLLCRNFEVRVPPPRFKIAKVS